MKASVVELKTPLSADQRLGPLREDVRTLGAMLGDALREQEGDDLFETVETVRVLSKKARAGDNRAFARLEKLLGDLPVTRAAEISRAFAHFLNLANVAEQHHRERRRRHYQMSPRSKPQPGSVENAIQSLVRRGLPPDEIHRCVSDQCVELVLTAHPTEIARRTTIRKYNRIAATLARRDHKDLTLEEQEQSLETLQREVTALWLTDEVRRTKPTPEDEARAGLIVIEESLWETVPQFLRSLDRSLLRHAGKPLPVNAAPVRFGSWMGGDRDGNPNVTPLVTRNVCLWSRWVAAGLYHRELSLLTEELSMRKANDELRKRVGPSAGEPYREIIKELRDGMFSTRRHLNAEYFGRKITSGAYYHDVKEVLEPLEMCYRSLHETGAGIVADGRLLDLIRRLHCFGLSLVKLDVRQESSRHDDAIAMLTGHLGKGDYRQWDEARRTAFLVDCLRQESNGFPVIDEAFREKIAALPERDPVRDVYDTASTLASIPHGSLGSYVISMARAPSDVLAVELIQHASGMRKPLPVVPLFETIDDLTNSGNTMRSLLSIPWYRERVRRCGDLQQVMIGYSDSTKDGGRLCAAWELYKGQESIVSACRESGVKATLFHGRGGTVGRGGGPIYLAVLSQPPGSVDGRLRVTEQGEMIQAKFGIPGIASRTLNLYTSATLEATLAPPAEPKPEWREVMETLAARARAAYRSTVYETEDFVTYWQEATPVEELGALNIGSRPARRKKTSGVGSIRAIPWIFSWTQTRLMLPSWLGTEEALEEMLSKRASARTLQAMYSKWPFFHSTLDLIEMVLAKADVAVAARYDEILVSPELRRFGGELRTRFDRAARAVLKVTGNRELVASNPVLRRSIDVRNPYVDPINLVQVEILRRLRCTEDEAERRELHDAFAVTANGVAAGMRNTG